MVSTGWAAAWFCCCCACWAAASAAACSWACLEASASLASIAETTALIRLLKASFLVELFTALTLFLASSMLSRDWLFSRFLTAVSALSSSSFSFLDSMAVLTVAIRFWNFSFLSASVTASTLLVAKSRLACVWSFSRFFTAVSALFSISLVFWTSFLPTSI